MNKFFRDSLNVSQGTAERSSMLVEPNEALVWTDPRFRGCLLPSIVLYIFLECLYLGVGSRDYGRCIPETKAKVVVFLLLFYKSEFLHEILMFCFYFTPKLRQGIESICYRVSIWGSVLILEYECKSVEVASFSGEH